MAWVFATAVSLLVWLICGLGWAAQRTRRNRLIDARKSFPFRREWLEAEFLTRASRTGKPRGLAWADCDFHDAVSFARDRASGNLRALVAITVRFEAMVGGEMEHVEAVSNLRSATAVFLYERGAWRTDGRAVFNLNPEETIQHFAHELEPMT